MLKLKDIANSHMIILDGEFIYASIYLDLIVMVDNYCFSTCIINHFIKLSKFNCVQQ